MRLTCIHCGRQFEQNISQPLVEHTCDCGRGIVFPPARETGVRPSYRAAQKLRFRAFLAAGIVNNYAHYALVFALAALVFPPFFIVSLIFSIMSLATPAGTLASYSGHKKALIAVFVGLFCAALSTGTFLSVAQDHRDTLRRQWQVTAAMDLKDLRYAQLTYKDQTGGFGSLGNLALQLNGFYTLCLGRGQRKLANPRKITPVEECPTGSFVESDKFLALAITNLDSDTDLDIWSIDQDGNINHVKNDL